MDNTKIRQDVEKIVTNYCDGTVINGLARSHFVEYCGDPPEWTPQTLADEIIAYIEKLVEESK